MSSGGLTAAQVARRVASREVSAEAVTRECLDRASRSATAAWTRSCT